MYRSDDTSLQELLACLLPCTFIAIVLVSCAASALAVFLILTRLQPEEITPEAPVPASALEAAPRYEWGENCCPKYNDVYVTEERMGRVIDFYREAGAECAVTNEEAIGFICTGFAQPYGDYTARVHRQSDIEVSEQDNYPEGETIIFMRVEWTYN